MEEANYDLIVFGATSFVGKLLCRYLSQVEETPPLRWAMAGRSQQKLDALRGELGQPDLDILVADAADEAALLALCRSTRLVVSTVGPYALYGETLVKCCASSGTDYCDLTGEAQWIARMIEGYQAQARESGARMVHCCGFDSIPSDLGVLYTQQHALHRLGEYCNEIRMQVVSAKGGFSGGTVASLMNLIDEVRRDPSLKKKMIDPYLLSERPATPVRQPYVSGPTFDPVSGKWLAPFMMAAINSKIVLRSNALLDYRYREDFRYSEAMATGRGLKGRMSAWTVTGSLAGMMIGGGFPPTRWLMNRFLLPAPGEGPSPKQQEEGYFKLRFYGATPSGQRIATEFYGDRDPGYGATARMLGQAALCLLRDDLNTAGGFWTPASLLGNALLDRLQKHVGIQLRILD